MLAYPTLLAGAVLSLFIADVLPGRVCSLFSAPFALFPARNLGLQYSLLDLFAPTLSMQGGAEDAVSVVCAKQ